MVERLHVGELHAVASGECPQVLVAKSQNSNQHLENDTLFLESERESQAHLFHDLFELVETDEGSPNAKISGKSFLESSFSTSTFEN